MERPNGMAYDLYANNDSNRPVGQVFTSAEQNAAGAATLPVNMWTHLAVTFASGVLKLFVNGTQTASVSLSGNVTTAAGALKIGGNAIWGEWFNGLIDEVRVYNRALTAAEVQSDMVSPIQNDTLPPSVPTNLAMTSVSATSASLSWT